MDALIASPIRAKGLTGPIGRLRAQVKSELVPDLQEIDHLTTHILGL